jgi:hypothetical protein
MGKLWDRLIAAFKGSIKAPEGPPRRSPWVLVAHVSPGPDLQCHFCGRNEAETGRQGEAQFGLVQARHNPRLEHVVCGDCLNWNRITAS